MSVNRNRVLVAFLSCLVFFCSGFRATSSQAPGAAAIPAGYYDDADTSNGAALRSSLHAIIDDHTRFPYTSTATDTWNILEDADEDPGSPNRVLDIYKNASYAKVSAGNSNYQREHSWPSSYGFPNDNSRNYPYTDAHHLFIANGSYNGSRSNLPYDTCSASCTERTTDVNNGKGGGSGTYPGNSNWRTGSGSTGTWETWRGRRGDVARALLYMDVRYEGGTHGPTGAAEPNLILTNNRSLISTTGGNAATAYMGLLSTLLDWHEEDPVDGKERARNDAVFGYQGNRNPFIDHPEWVDIAFGGGGGGGPGPGGGEDDDGGGGGDPPMGAGPVPLPGAPRSLAYTLTSDRVILEWLPPTSGGPVRSYQILAGSSSGRKNLANFDTFQNATKINLKIGEGQYYVRVNAKNPTGQSTSSSNEVFFVVTGSPSVPNPVFVEPTINITQDFFGDVLVMGEIQNRVLGGGGAPTFVRIEATFLSPGGSIVGEDFTFLTGRSRRLRASGIVTDTALLPGQRACFMMFTNIPASQVATVTLGGTFDTFANDPLQGRLRFGQYTQQADSLGDLQMVGTASNVGSRRTHFNKVVFDVKTPKVQTCDFTFVSGSTVVLPSGVSTSTALSPGQVGTFTNFTNIPFGPIEVRRYTQWDEVAPAGASAAVEQMRANDAAFDAVFEDLQVSRSLLLQLMSGPGTPSRLSIHYLRSQIEAQLRELELRMAGVDAAPALPIANSIALPVGR